MIDDNNMSTSANADANAIGCCCGFCVVRRCVVRQSIVSVMFERSLVQNTRGDNKARTFIPTLPNNDSLQ